jgi:CheY-like chemotaxis protein
VSERAMTHMPQTLSKSVDKDLQSMRILVVDDNTAALQLIKSMLQDLGLPQVFLAKDGKEALDFMGFCNETTDLVLCDWNMPRMTGLELLKQVRAVNPDLPFLMITGTADLQSVMEAKGSGVTGYIKKPFSADELRKKLNVIARIKAHRR